MPVDPRHRLVVPKYNPARTYTPEGELSGWGLAKELKDAGVQHAQQTFLPHWSGLKRLPALLARPDAGGVGIGGAYMCIYPMASPGGYQLVGRTLPIWNAFTRTGPFQPGKPWLLRNFDQVGGWA